MSDQPYFIPDATDLQLPITECGTLLVSSTGAGSRVQATASHTFTRGCDIQAVATNTNTVHIGGPGVNVNSFNLMQTQSVHLNTNDLYNIWIYFEGESDVVQILYGK